MAGITLAINIRGARACDAKPRSLELYLHVRLAQREGDPQRIHSRASKNVSNSESRLAYLPKEESVVYPRDGGIRGRSVHTIDEAMIEVLESQKKFQRGRTEIGYLP
jgi:hypothetical protein